MRIKQFESSIVHGEGGNRLLWLVGVFLAAPLLWLLLGYWFGERIIFGWLVIASAYVVALLVGAGYCSPIKNGSRRRWEALRLLTAWLSPLFWGGVLAMPYLFAYAYLFDRENFFPR